MIIEHHKKLASLTTLGLGGSADCFIFIEQGDQWADVLARCEGVALNLLGAGSNVVISDAGVRGTVLQWGTRRISSVRDEGVFSFVQADAGVDWQDWVNFCVENQLQGVESLFGIPGTVGACPVQNVGAYGQEVAASIHEVCVYSVSQKKQLIFSHDECRFSYRNSFFKEENRKSIEKMNRIEYVISSVVFKMIKSQQSSPIRYDELARQLNIKTGESATLVQVRAAVECIRKKKGMLPPSFYSENERIQSAGSFMTNPQITVEQLQFLQKKFPDEKIPAHADHANTYKLSAAWLIERAGFHRGYRINGVGVSSHHALALVNHSALEQGSSLELMQLAGQIIDAVHSLFGVKLEIEPVFMS